MDSKIKNNDSTKSNLVYLAHHSSTKIEELYLKVMTEIIIKKRYLEPTFTAKQLAKELHTSASYISAVMTIRYNGSFPELLNMFRVKYAIFLMRNSRYDHMTCEEIGMISGFTNRQNFYRAFFKETNTTPLLFRKTLSNK